VETGLNIITLPKTIDNDIALTDATIGFDTALGIATEAIDRLHSTAHSHHRIIIAEVMGHRAGWLALGAGIAGGADVILIPEIPYDVTEIASAIRLRSKHGTNFSIVAVAEGAMSKEDAAAFAAAAKRKENAKTKTERQRAKTELTVLTARHSGNTLRLSKQLEELTHLEARVDDFGVCSTRRHTLGGGSPAGHPARHHVCGIDKRQSFRRDGCRAWRWREARPDCRRGRKLKLVPIDHAWIESARRVGTSLGG